MHYKAYEFSSNRLPTMEPRNPSISENILGSSIQPTEFDIMHLNLLYCDGKYTCNYTDQTYGKLHVKISIRHFHKDYF